MSTQLLNPNPMNSFFPSASVGFDVGTMPVDVDSSSSLDKCLSASTASPLISLGSCGVQNRMLSNAFKQL